MGEDLEGLTASHRVLLRGLGRSYGDSSLPAPGSHQVINTTMADRVLAWDPHTGVLRAEAGLSLHTINRLFLAQGWFTPVSPGTQFVTLGGMVASDVHGKNHHVAGCFGAHVRSLRMRVADGRILTISPKVEPDLFWATIGGMGWTGAILEVEVQMRRASSPWIRQHSERIGDLATLVNRLKQVSQDWPMTMAWIDCLKRGPHMGRGVLYYGGWLKEDEAASSEPVWRSPLTIPFDAPSWALNPMSMSLFNFGVYHGHVQRHKEAVVSPEVFYYPLDRFLHWNRAYGRSGFTQYQCVIPEAAGPQGVVAFMDLLTRLGASSFLCVLKDCGPQGQGILSFPMAGTSVAVDIPIKAETAQVVSRLNKLVVELGGRIYLSKDQFTTAEDFRAMEPRLERFLAIRQIWDPDRLFRSAQSARLFGDQDVHMGAGR